MAAIAGLIFGFMQRKKMLTIVAAPFKPTGQVQGGADAAGLISCQGAIRADQPLVAPVSGRQCLYYEIEIKQEWEKHVSTEDGVKKQTGKDTAHTDKTGSLFLVDDGSGPVQVDAREKVDAKLEKSHTEKKSYGWGDISFGNYQVHINRPSDSDKHAIATHLVEKILPAEGDLFVVGKLQGDTITKRDGLLGNLMLAREGRDALMGATKRNMMIGFIAGGVMLLSGAPMAIFGEAPEAAADTCASMSDGLAQPCMGRLYGSSDVIYPWTVLTEGDYRFDTVGTGSDPVMRLWPSIRVLDAAGTEVYTLQGAGGAPAQGQAHFAAGTYNIHVNDTSTGHAANLEGGAGFSL
ncbi:MAG: E3 ubiquitin ligase family protein, partial [Myxococcales bacterium]|nr:E3 ubiquitin ligase family protein [Myxococcales bacterium]